MSINAKIGYPGKGWSEREYTRVITRKDGNGVWERTGEVRRMYGRCYIAFVDPATLNTGWQSEEPFEILVRVMEVFAEIRVQ